MTCATQPSVQASSMVLPMGKASGTPPSPAMVKYTATSPRLSGWWAKRDS